MKRMTFGAAVLVCAALAQSASAGVIISSTGNSEASVPLGYYAPYGTATVYEVSWSQASTYTNVDVFANLFNPGGGGIVNYALTTGIGAGMTFAQDGIVEGSVSTLANPTDTELFQIPELAAGTYYLVLSSPTPNASWQWNFPLQANITTSTGVTYLGSQQAQFNNIDNTYAPASTFSGINIPVEFSVTGTAASTPEPAYEGAFGLGLLGLAALLRKVRSRAEKSPGNE